MARESRSASQRSWSSAAARLQLAERLRARRQEIEQTLLARVYSVADPGEVGDPHYVEGLRAAVSAALTYAIGGIEAGDPQPGPIPAELYAQARHAARAGVSLDTVLRRYLAGHTLLGDFLICEAERVSLPHEELQRLLRAQANLVDQLIAAIGAEHAREATSPPPSAERRRAKCVQRLLAGELADAAELAYDLGGHHLGLIARGPGAREGIRELAGKLDCRLLAIGREDESVWAWLGGARPIGPERVEALFASCWPAGAVLAIGEPAAGLEGWRLTHRQAAAALPVALRTPERRSRYADVALLASALQDEVLAASLHELYLAPLCAERDGGEVWRRTLRAYFSTRSNVSSTAAALGVTRKTVTTRLRAIERRLGRPLAACAAELETALRLEEMQTGYPVPLDPPTLDSRRATSR